MKEIKEYIYSLLINDSTLQGLLGSVDSDKRIYHIGTRKKEDYEVNEKKKAFITYYVNTGAQTDELNSATKPPEYVTFDIYAIDFSTAEDVFERLDILFPVTMDFTTTNYRITGVIREMKTDGLPSDINAKRITVRYRFKYIIT